MVKKTVRFGEQAAVPAIGLGTWYMGEHAAQRQQEVAALRAGIDHGLTVPWLPPVRSIRRAPSPATRSPWRLASPA